MDAGQLPLFRLAEARLKWLDQRQQALAQNIANADQPNYARRDMPAFARSLSRLGATAPARTAALHLGPLPGSSLSGSGRPQRQAIERTPNGNAVQIESELVQVSDTESQHGLTLSLYRKYLGLFRTALGRQG